MKNITPVILLTLLPSAALAADETIAESYTRPHLIINALRDERPLNQVASSVTVIDQEQLQRENKQTLTEVLRGVPGLSVAQSGGPGQTTRVFMRGMNSNHLLVLVDGMVVNDPSDPATAYDFSNLTTDNIEQIEILRGPQSTLYGSQALGGVINVVTKKGAGTPKITGTAEYGRYNSAKLQSGINGTAGGTSYSLSAATSHTNGISVFDKKFGGREKDAANTYTLSANVASKLTDNFTAKLNGRYNRLDAELDSVGSIGNFGARPDDDREPTTDSRQLNLRAAGELSLLGGNWVQELGFSTLHVTRDYITEYFDSFFAPHFGGQDYQGRRDTIDWVHHLKLLPSHKTTVGFEAYTDYFKRTDLKSQNVDNRAAFIDDQYFITPDLFVNYGGRVDDHQAFGRAYTWKVSPGYDIKATGTRLKASYGTGFKAPSLSQLFDPVAGNPNLDPERSKGYDFGFEQSLLDEKLIFGSTVFRNHITDLIGFGPSPLFLTLNVGKARTQGVENSITVKPVKGLTLTTNYTYTQAENRKTHADLLRRPKHQFLFGSTYDYSDKGDVGLNMRYNSSRRDFYWQNSSLTTIAGYTVVDLVTNYKVNKNASVYARLDNVLDKRYEEISGYGQPGRGLYVGIKASY